MNRYSLYYGLLWLSAALLLFSSITFANPWEQVNSPFDGEAAAVGSYANGCLAGGKALPSSGPGFEVIRPERRRYFGHPTLISFIEDYSSHFWQYSKSKILIADMSMPRGGNFTHGHTSHQIGLDVDIWLKLAEQALTVMQLAQPEPFDIVNTKQFRLDSKLWQAQHTRMVQLAAEDSRVARIFISPVIKQHLCDMDLANDAWLNKVRPWWGHTYHMHVRLHCPEDDVDCIEQAPIPKGNGCNELSWWKQQYTQPKLKPKTKAADKAIKKNKKVKPKQCEQLLNS